jgi:hypothetical protein
MTIHEEFLQILRILSEEPQPAGRKPPSAEKEHTSDAHSDKSEQSTDKQRQGTGA